MAAERLPNTLEGFSVSNVESGASSNNDEEFKTIQDAYFNLRKLFPKSAKIEMIIAYINLYIASFRDYTITDDERGRRKFNFQRGMLRLDELRMTLNIPKQVEFDITLGFINKVIEENEILKVKKNQEDRERSLARIAESWGGKRKTKRKMRKNRRRNTYRK
jgi:hypothetical protein